MLRYKVMIDDNFHYQDPDERWNQGTYETAAEAVAVCQRVVDQFLKGAYRPGMSALALYEVYTSFGDDPFVTVVDGVDESAKFSAWDYARERCHTLCGEDPASTH